MQATPETEVPTQLGEWKIERKLGEGGMGSVYLGRSENSGVLAAIKVLPKALALLNASYRERFFREASLAARRISMRQRVEAATNGGAQGQKEGEDL